MSYTRDGDRVTVAMSLDDYEQLLIALGHIAGIAHREDRREEFYGWISLVNRLNEGNPSYKPYEIPEQYRHQGVKP